MQQINKFMKKVAAMGLMVAVLLCSVIAVDVCTGNVMHAEAAAIKTKAYDLAIAETFDLSKKISGKNKKATYTYSSSKKTIATVSKKGVVTTKAAGTTKITVKEKKNGKTSMVGTVKITVHKAEVSQLVDYEFTTAEGAFEKKPYQMPLKYDVKYINPKAVYTWYSKNPKAVTISKDGLITSIKKEYLTLEDDYRASEDLIIKETYKGKTRKVGIISVWVYKPGLEVKKGSVIELKKGETYNTYFLVTAGTYNYRCVLSDDYYETENELLKAIDEYESSDDHDSEPNPIVDFIHNEDGYPMVQANGIGERYLYCIGYNYVKDTYDDYLGYVKIVVTE